MTERRYNRVGQTMKLIMQQVIDQDVRYIKNKRCLSVENLFMLNKKCCRIWDFMKKLTGKKRINQTISDIP